MDADRRCLAWLWLFLLAVYLLTMAGRLVSGDGETMYLTTKALLTRGELAIEARAETAEGREGRAYSKYGLGQSVAQAPFFVAGHAVGTLFGATDDRPTRFAVGMTNSVVTATLAGVFWLLLRQLGSGRGAATVASLVLGLATLAWPYARADFAEPLQATMLLLALYGLVRWRRQPTLAWAALTGAAAGAAVLTKVASVILLPPLGLYFAVALWERFGKPNPPRGRPSALRAFTRLPGAGRGTPADGSPVGVTRSPARQRPTWADLLAQVPPFPVEKGARGLGPLPHLAAAALPFALCVAFQAALNVYRFGSVAEFGYGDEPATGFTTPVLEGIGNLLFSSGKGLFFFAPPIVLGLAMLPQLARRYALEAAVVALIFLSELLYYARWWAWHGDWCWGPRYLVVTVPFLMVGWGTLLSAWRQSPLLLRAGAGLLAGAGFGVSLLGVAI
ncbi:MAG: phospholipid carrier-dependent glycosyltransferase, partial [Chloroflexota bacterium]